MPLWLTCLLIKVFFELFSFSSSILWHILIHAFMHAGELIILDLTNDWIGARGASQVADYIKEMQEFVVNYERFLVVRIICLKSYLHDIFHISISSNHSGNKLIWSHNCCIILIKLSYSVSHADQVPPTKNYTKYHSTWNIFWASKTHLNNYSITSKLPCGKS